jgi:hypothetical protein
MIASMGPDSYWFTCSIADAQAEDYTHLRATCPGCRRIADVAWPLLIGRRGTTRETFLGNIPLRCQRFGNTAPKIAVRQLSTA